MLRYCSSVGRHLLRDVRFVSLLPSHFLYNFRCRAYYTYAPYFSCLPSPMAFFLAFSWLVPASGPLAGPRLHVCEQFSACYSDCDYLFAVFLTWHDIDFYLNDFYPLPLQAALAGIGIGLSWSSTVGAYPWMAIDCSASAFSCLFSPGSHCACWLNATCNKYCRRSTSSAGCFLSP